MERPRGNPDDREHYVDPNTPAGEPYRNVDPGTPTGEPYRNVDDRARMAEEYQQPDDRGTYVRRSPETRGTYVRRTPGRDPGYEDVPDRWGVYGAQDVVRWGPIIGGVVAALSALVLLSVLGAAVGLGISASNGTTGGAANNLTTGSAIWGFVVAIIAFFIGGWVAARTAAVGGSFAAVVNGALVWGFTVVSAIILAALGMGSLFGVLGSPFSSAGGVSQGQLSMAQTAAWVAFGALLVGLIFSVLGGLVGSHRGAENY